MTRTVGELEHEVERLEKELTAAYRERNELRAGLEQARERIRALAAPTERDA